MMPALQRYMKQRSLTDQGAGPAGAGGMPAQPVGPGVADPFNSGASSPPVVNPDDGMNEFDPRRRPRPYMNPADTTDMPAQVNGRF